MRYGIFSDIHNNLEALETVLEALKKEEVDRYLCAGDIVGYAANPKECIRLVRQLDCPIVCGNHERAVTGLLEYSYFNEHARIGIEWTTAQLSDDEKKYLESFPLTYEDADITMAHGSLEKPEEFEYIFSEAAAKRTLSLCRTTLCFIGHTHCPFIYSWGAKRLINVGSVGQPRDGDPRASYCIYDSKKDTVQIKRVGYDIDIVMEKILAAGLPEFLASRLRTGS